MTMRGTVLPNGIGIQTNTSHEKLWRRMVAHYSEGHSALWRCPWCGGEIDSVCYEKNAETFEDTYRCIGTCNLLITFFTPAKYVEYHEVPDYEWRVFVEKGIGGGNWYAPEEADDPIGDCEKP